MRPHWTDFHVHGAIIVRVVVVVFYWPHGSEINIRHSWSNWILVDHNMDGIVVKEMHLWGIQYNKRCISFCTKPLICTFPFILWIYHLLHYLSHTKLLLNSLVSGRFEGNSQVSNFPANFGHWWLSYIIFLNCPPIRAGASTTLVLVLPKMINMNILKTLYSSTDFPVLVLVCWVLAPALPPMNVIVPYWW